MQDAVAGRLRVGRPLSRRSDAALVRSAQGGSAEAAEELFRRHWPAAHRAAWLVVHDAAAAEDIAQEAFMAAVRSLDRFDRRRPLGPWLHRIVVNRAIDWARARALRPEAGADAVPEAGRARRPRPTLGDELVAALAELGARAPRGRRPASPARVHAGRDRRDARAPRGTVNSRLRRALDALSLALEDDAMTRDARARAARGRAAGRRPARERARRTVLARARAGPVAPRVRGGRPLVWPRRGHTRGARRHAARRPAPRRRSSG